MDDPARVKGSAAQRGAALEEELSCPICYDFFHEAVSLSCQHSFCRACLEEAWRSRPERDCPVCRRKSSLQLGVPNLTLRNIVAAYLQGEGEGAGAGEGGRRPERAGVCRRHRRKVRAFCGDCEEALCAACLEGERHSLHTRQPVEDAAVEYKGKLCSQLQALQQKLEAFNQERAASDHMAQHISSEAQRVERQIKAEFERLHQFLREEERDRLASLRKEEQQKSARMRERIEGLTEQVVALTETISDIEARMEAEDSSFLEGYKNIKERAQCKLQDPEPVSGALIDVAKHLGNLRFRVWEKMLEMVQYTPVTLDVNSAHPDLRVSHSLLEVWDGEASHPLPDNAERFDSSVSVLGAEAFTAGRHCWDMEVGGKTAWTLGVAREAVGRKGAVSVSPDGGLWVVGLWDGEESTSLDEDLCCPVCCDTFREPVVLRCSHSFCKACLDTYWRDKAAPDCPVCRRRSSTESPPVNLALRNIVESYLRDQRAGAEENKPVVAPRRIGRANSEAARSQAAGDSEPRCGLHGEKLQLYCAFDQEPICVVCQASRKHRNHQLSPVDEAALDLKEEVRTSLRPLKEKLENFNRAKQQCVKTAEHIQAQARQAEDQIKKEFEKLRHFLRVEEASRISALMNETERKSMIMKEKIDHLTIKMASLSDTIKCIEKEMQAEDVSFLQAYKYVKERAQCKLQAPEPVSGALINMAKHLGNLKFRVWEKMQEMVQYTPVTLDPNTAAPWLSLSNDLTSVQYQGEQLHIPDNPERCDLCVCVLGAEDFTSGRHSWEVEVGNKTKWDLGVMKESIQRKGVLSVNPSQGFWAIALRDGSRYSACTQPWTPLTLKRKPQRIRVLLDYDNGLVSFFDHGDMSLIYTFKASFTERLFPYFSPCVSARGQNAEPLKICSAKVSIVMM
ncbi:hypothetical protein MATL_G00186870 [Megalops atlanticus]|uniref:Uncharacterized protein n=1 Tax=Megalops atlanticus TaxID=7932 RepID=A0A9D3PMJ0_MEGAT|nr:hypothetical protein MATL_G00186870 [Megalops atlanticus]